MNGLEFLERRRSDKLHPQVPVVLVTTEGTTDDEAPRPGRRRLGIISESRSSQPTSSGWRNASSRASA